MSTSEDWIREPISHTVLDDVEQISGWLSAEEAALLFNLARHTSEGSIVEIGSYHGRSTVALAKGALDGGNRPVFAIEPHEKFVGALGSHFGPEDRGAFFKTMLKTGSYINVRLVNLSSEIITPGWNMPVSLLWIDGDHSYHGVKRDFECWKKHLTPEAYIAFDDATDQNLGPHKLINELIQSCKYKLFTVTGKVAVLKMISPT